MELGATFSTAARRAEDVPVDYEFYDAVRDASELDAALADGDTLIIAPGVAGG